MPDSGDLSYKSRSKGSSGQSRISRVGTGLRESSLNARDVGNSQDRHTHSRLGRDGAQNGDDQRGDLWRRMFEKRTEFATRRSSKQSGSGDRPSDARAVRRSSVDTGARKVTVLHPNPVANQDQPRSLFPRRGNRGGEASLANSRNTGSVGGTPTPARAASVSARRRHRAPSKPRSPGVSALLYAARMLILSVGIGVLAGTVLSVWDPASRSATTGGKQANVTAGNTANRGAAIASTDQMSRLGQELTPMKAPLQALIQKQPQMAPGIFLLDLDRNAYLDMNGSNTFSAASTMKVPILIAFLQDVDAGKIRLDEQLTLRKELVGGGSGDMQYQPVGTRYSALDTAIKMITISDNTATNLIIARLGGISVLNQRFQSWGLVATRMNNLLPDLEGTNTTSPKELTLLMVRISQGDLLSMRSRDRMLDIMRRTENDSQLPQGLGPGATIAHKTGDIGSLIGDVGLIDLPNGKRYALTVLVKRGHNDDRAYDVVSQISRVAYQYFSRSSGAPTAIPGTATPNRQTTSSREDSEAVDVSALMSNF